jgi:thiaminase
MDEEERLGSNWLVVDTMEFAPAPFSISPSVPIYSLSEFARAYAGAPYQEVAAKARAHLDRLANLYVTPAREAELVTIFKEATRLETDFREMGWRAGPHGE